jgi:multiple sugar transport system substrate-binding protein
MEKNSRKILMPFMLAVCIVWLGACGRGGDTAQGGSAPERKISITYWTHENPAFNEVANRLSQNYMKENPGVNIKLEYFPDLTLKVYSSLSAGTCGDIVEFYGSVLRLAKDGTILPVSESIIDKTTIESMFYPATLQNRLWEGKYYGLPEELNIESPGLLVNTGLLREQNVEIPAAWKANNGPATWTELMNLARSLTIFEGETMKQAGLGVIGGEESALFLSYIWQLGGDYRDPDNMTVSFQTSEAKKAAEFILGLIEGPNAVHSALFSGRFDGFKEGSVAMTICAPWYTAVINQDVPGFQYEYYNLPPFVDGSKPYFVAEGGWGQFVAKTAKNPEECWKFIKFLLQDENLVEWSKSTGNLPSGVKLIEHEFYKSGDGHDVIFRAMLMAEYGQDPGAYTLDPFTIVWDIIPRNLQSINTRQVSVDEGLANIQKESVDLINSLK